MSLGLSVTHLLSTNRWSTLPRGRGDDLARFRVQESVTTSATVDGMRMGVNMTELGQIKVAQGEIFYPGWERMGASGGRGEFTGRYASDESPVIDGASRVRKRCRRYRSATAVQNASWQGYIAFTNVRNQGMALPQGACGAGSVPDGPTCRTRLRQSSARQGGTNSTGPPRQFHPFWNFESDPNSITLPALI